MLPDRDWLEAAQGLREGGRDRINHDCGDGTPLLVSHNRDDYSAYCFRCGIPGYHKKPDESWQDRLARLTRERNQDDTLRESVSLPTPTNFNVSTWPRDAQVWLFKAGLGYPEIQDLGAYYHDPTGRVILPVFDGSDLIYWQARDASWRRSSKRPKYINPSVDKQFLVARYGRGRPLVLCEDVLSAYRIGQITEAWSLLGTTLHDKVSARIDPGTDVAVWMDPDRAGRRASREIIRVLTAQGINAVRVYTRADPKQLSRREIHGFLYPTT